jgi:hypothetical protein
VPQSGKKILDLNFTLPVGSTARSCRIFFKMPHSDEFFWLSAESEKTLSAFTEAVKVTVYKKKQP